MSTKKQLRMTMKMSSGKELTVNISAVSLEAPLPPLTRSPSPVPTGEARIMAS